MYLIDAYRAGEATARTRTEVQRDFEFEIVEVNCRISNASLHGDSSFVTPSLSENAIRHLEREKYVVEKDEITSMYTVQWNEQADLYKKREANRAKWLKNRKRPCGECGMTGGPGAIPGSYSGCPVCGYCA